MESECIISQQICMIDERLVLMIIGDKIHKEVEREISGCDAEVWSVDFEGYVLKVNMPLKF